MSNKRKGNLGQRANRATRAPFTASQEGSRWIPSSPERATLIRRILNEQWRAEGFPKHKPPTVAMHRELDEQMTRDGGKQPDLMPYDLPEPAISDLIAESIAALE